MSNIQISYVHMHDVPAPVLDGDARLFERANVKLHQRLKGERRVVFELIEWMRLRGWLAIGVDNGEEYIETTTTKDAMEHVFSVDDAAIRFESVHSSKRHSVCIILGNAPEEVIADWTETDGDPDGFGEAVESFTDGLM